MRPWNKCQFLNINISQHITTFCSTDLRCGWSLHCKLTVECAIERILKIGQQRWSYEATKLSGLHFAPPFITFGFPLNVERGYTYWFAAGRDEHVVEAAGDGGRGLVDASGWLGINVDTVDVLRHVDGTQQPFHLPTASHIVTNSRRNNNGQSRVQKNPGVLQKAQPIVHADVSLMKLWQILCKISR